MNEQIARSAMWIVWSRGAFQIVTFLGTLVTMRLLSPADYGLMALAGIWTLAISWFAECGIGAAIVQFRDVEEFELNACFWLTMGLATVGYLAIYASAPAVGAWLDSPAFPSVLRAVSLALLLNAARAVPDGLLRKRLMLDNVSQVEIISGALALPVVIWMAWAGWGVWALVAGALLMPLVQTVLTFWFARWWPAFGVGGRQLPSMLRYGLTTLGGRLCFVAHFHSDALVLGKLAGDATVGFYSIAKQLAFLSVEKLSVAANHLASPVMAGLQEDREAMRAFFLRVTRIVAWTTFPVNVALMVVGRDLVLVVFTEKWLPMVPLLYVLCPAAMIQAIAVLLLPVLSARYRVGFVFRYYLILSVLMPVAFWTGATWLGALGVAGAWLMVNPLVTIWMARTTLHSLGTSWGAVWAELRPPLGAAFVMLVVSLGAQWSMPAPANDIPEVRLMTGLVVGGAAYVMSILRFGGKIRDELRGARAWLAYRARPVPETK